VTPDELLVVLKARGAKLTDTGASLNIDPPSLVTPDELAFIQANAEAIADLLRVRDKAGKANEPLSIELDIDAAVTRQREAAEAALLSRMPPPQKVTRYRNVDGIYVPLHQLTAEDVQRLRRRGSLTDEEAKQWLSRHNKPLGGSIF
jgi:hypothetical protein